MAHSAELGRHQVPAAVGADQSKRRLSAAVLDFGKGRASPVFNAPSVVTLSGSTSFGSLTTAQSGAASPMIVSPLVAGGRDRDSFLAVFEREDVDIRRDCDELFRRQEIKHMLVRLAEANPEFAKSQV